MASKSTQLLLASVVCCGPLLVAGPAGLRAQQDAPAAAPAQQQQQQPDRPGPRGFRPGPGREGPLSPQTRPDEPGRPGWLFDRMGKNAAVSTRPPTDEEWRQTAELIAELSPSRWQVFEQILDKPVRGERARRFLFARYTELRELEAANPNVYGARVEQVKIEDEIFRLESDLREVKSPGEAEQVRAELRGKVTEWVKRDLDERDLRLRQLQDRLDRERADLDADRERVEEIADRRLEGIRRSSERFRAWAAGKAGPEQGGNRPQTVPATPEPPR